MMPDELAGPGRETRRPTDRPPPETHPELATHIHAAVNGDGRARNERRKVAEEEDGRAGDVFRKADAAERKAFGDFLPAKGVEARRGHFGLGPRGSDTVHPYLVSSKLLGHGAHEENLRAL